ncbi:MAG: hypothetical protein HYU73_24290 [Betaproteobacteria bacterium]|nr:hypothetical protein [Betaproteobacteria bacterium]
MPKQFLNPPELGVLAGPYSQGVRSGNTIWVSAQAGHDAEGRIIGANDPEAQCRAIFQRIGAVQRTTRRRSVEPYSSVSGQCSRQAARRLLT